MTTVNDFFKPYGITPLSPLEVSNAVKGRYGETTNCGVEWVTEETTSGILPFTALDRVSIQAPGIPHELAYKIDRALRAQGIVVEWKTP